MFRSLFKTQMGLPLLLRRNQDCTVSMTVPPPHLLRRNRDCTVSMTAPPPHLLYLLRLKSLSTTAATTSNSQSRVSSADYLVKSLALSSDSELVLEITQRKHLNLKSTANADSVLALFKDYGFSPSQMARIFSVCPKLLSFDPHKYLQPKLDFFTQMGVSHILSVDPNILKTSLEKQIIPCFNFLKTFFAGGNKNNNNHHQHQEIVSFFSMKRSSWLLRKYSEKMARNVEMLRLYGVPDSNIVRFFLNGGDQVLSRDAELFSEALKEIKEMGFNPSDMAFVYGLRVLLGVKKEKWVSKMEVFKSFGWNDEQVLALFMTLPTVMRASEEKIKEALDFFMNKLKWTPDDITIRPFVITCSFEKRVLPRFCVLEILMSKGLLKNKTSMYSAYVASDSGFLSKFVNKYQEDIPQLLDIYQEKMRC